MGHTKISTSQQHYHSVDKFDSVQKAARTFNTKYKPKNSKYCAGENTTFAPDGFIPEQTSIDTVVKSTATTEESKRPIIELLDELISYPEFSEMFKKFNQQKKSELEAE